MYFRECKTLSVFERKIPLTLEFRPYINSFVDFVLFFFTIP
jgi:hypothetical protein